MHHFLTDIGIAIIAATIVGVLIHRLKQPIILGYLLAGIIIGPGIGEKIVYNPENIQVISEIGLILLLFIIGLEMDIKKMLSSGKQIFIVGIGQFVISILIGTTFFVLIGFSFNSKSLDALYLSIACALSSTAIVVKLLYDKCELDTLSGRLTLGILIIQDIWAIFVIVLQPYFRNPQYSLLLISLLKCAILVGAGFLFSRYILKQIFSWLTKSPEMITTVSIGWCAIMAGTAEYMGLSMEMGALIAGLSISVYPYSIHVTAKVLPLRDFFLTLFFIALGMRFSVPDSGMITKIIIVVAFSIISKGVIIYVLTYLSGGGRRKNFITSLNLSQIGEFSLVITSIGFAKGHISNEVISIILYAMAVTSVISSYAIKYNNEIFRYFNNIVIKIFRVSEVKDPASEAVNKTISPIVILGYHRGSRALVDSIYKSNSELLNDIVIVDFNLEIIKELESKNIKALYGDISSLDDLIHINLQQAKIIIATISERRIKGIDNVSLVKNCRQIAPDAYLIASTAFNRHIPRLKNAGANEVLAPYDMAAEEIVNILLDKS